MTLLSVHRIQNFTIFHSSSNVKTSSQCGHVEPRCVSEIQGITLPAAHLLQIRGTRCHAMLLKNCSRRIIEFLSLSLHEDRCGRLYGWFLTSDKHEPFSWNQNKLPDETRGADSHQVLAFLWEGVTSRPKIQLWSRVIWNSAWSSVMQIQKIILCAVHHYKRLLSHYHIVFFYIFICFFLKKYRF